MNAVTLTREQAHDLIDDCENRDALRALSVHWIGHDQDGLSAEELLSLLHEYVDAAAFNGDDERSNGPKDDDPTDLTAP